MATNLIIGVDIGGTRTKYGLVNIATSQVLQSIVQPTEKKGAAIFLGQIGRVVNEFRTVTAEQTCHFAVRVGS